MKGETYREGTMQRHRGKKDRLYRGHEWAFVVRDKV